LGTVVALLVERWLWLNAGENVVNAQRPAARIREVGSEGYAHRQTHLQNLGPVALDGAVITPYLHRTIQSRRSRSGGPLCPPPATNESSR
jgi:hypothetical protein